MKQDSTEKEDFYFNEQGNMVFTKKYLLQREECCGNGCKHCPYNYVNVEEPMRSELIKAITSLQ